MEAWSSDGTLQEFTRPRKRNFLFLGRGCPKIGFWQFPSKSTFYPINKIPKEQMRCAPPVTSFSVRDPNPSVLIKVPKNTKSCQMVPRTMIPPYHWYHGTPVPWYPVYHGYHWYHAYHATMVPRYHGTMNFGPSLGGRRPTYPGGLGGGAPQAKRKK